MRKDRHIFTQCDHISHTARSSSFVVGFCECLLSMLPGFVFCRQPQLLWVHKWTWTLWVSVLITVHCTKLLWSGLNTALIYRYKDINLDDSLILCLFSAIMVRGLPLRPESSMPQFHDQTDIIRHVLFSLGVGLYPVGKKMATSIMFLPLLHPYLAHCMPILPTWLLL